MAPTDIEVVEEAIDAFNRRDLAGLAALADPAIEFVPYVTSRLEDRTYRRREGLLHFLQDAGSTWEEIRIETPGRPRIEGNYVLAVGKLAGRGRGSGVDVDIAVVWLFDVERGRIRRVEGYPNEAEAKEAAANR